MTRVRVRVAVVTTILVWVTVGTAGEPYRTMTAAPGYAGPGREIPDPVVKTVRLGVIAPAKSDAGKRLVRAVRDVVGRVNREGGYKGIPFEVVFRADDGPWGMGAKQVAALAYEDSVWAVIGGLNGGAAHLAELVAAKTWVPFVTPTASDLSVDYANVPWVFRCFPTDRDQAAALVGHAIERDCTKFLVLYEATRDGRLGLARVRAALARYVTDTLSSYEYSLLEPFDPSRVAALSSADAVVVWGEGQRAADAAAAIRAFGYEGVLLGPSGLLAGQIPEGIDIVTAGPPGATASVDPVASFTTAAAEMVVAAVRQAGLNRTRIRDALAEGRFETSVGEIRFDALGGSGLMPVLMTRGKGEWVRVK